MATAEERLKILKMIDEGKISAEEGAKLLAALSESRRPDRKAPVRGAAGTRWLRVRVTDTFTGDTAMVARVSGCACPKLKATPLPIECPRMAV